MKDLDTLFEAYSADHQNPQNQKIHYVCVPIIVYSIFGLLWALPTLNYGALVINWAWVFAAVASTYYFLLSPKLAVLMLGLVGLGFLSFYTMEGLGLPLAWISGALFVAAWIGQFYGHKIEGRKPSFLTDLTYLFIGPLWVLRKAFFKPN